MAPIGTEARSSSAATAGLMLAPAAAVLLVFWFFPVLAALAVSFTNWEGADPWEIVGWVGGRNYRRILADREFWLALANTVNYALYAVPLTLGSALVLALLIHRLRRGRDFLRTLFFLPHASAWVAVAMVWNLLFSFDFGPLNAGLRAVGLDPLRWLEEPRGIIEMFATGMLGLPRWPDPPVIGPLLAGPSLALFSIILTTVWRDLGFFLVVFLAGLANIDPVYQEAARLDGAGPWQRLRHVTLPLLKPTTFFCLIVGTIGAFRVFVPILIMTPQGGPGKTTQTLIFYLYQKGFVEWRLGLGAAVAWLFLLLLIGLTAAQNRWIGRRVGYES